RVCFSGPSRWRNASKRTAPETARSARLGSRPGTRSRCSSVNDASCLRTRCNCFNDTRRLRNDASGARPTPLPGPDHAAETQDGSRRADHPIEARARELIEVTSGLNVDVLEKFSLVARFERIVLDESFREANHAKLEAPADVHCRPRALGDFDAAAADVDDHDLAFGAHAVGGRQVNEPGFLGARNDSWPNAGLLGDDPQKLAAVFGLASGAGCHGHDFFDAVRLGETAELRQAR